jgi:hypothetical protein
MPSRREELEDGHVEMARWYYWSFQLNAQKRKRVHPEQ